MTEMRDFCLKCDDFGECNKLCAEALEYADQDKFKENPKKVVYTNPQSLAYLQFEFPLSHAEMINDLPLGIYEWHYVKKCGLTEQQMQCMWLYYWEENTMAEISKKLGISEPTVHKHLKYGKKKLKKYLKSG